MGIEIEMKKWQGKVAIVTGASSGIGEKICERLVRLGLEVVGLARRKEKIDELAESLQNQPGKLHGVRADFTEEGDILNAFKWVKDNLGPIHILINSAGVARETKLMDGKTVFWKDILDVNVLALCIATREAVKDMRENNVDGHIVHINSVLGHIAYPIPNMSVYPASKFAVTALTETLRQELNSIGSKIKISSISPGLVNTDMTPARFRDSGLEEMPEETKMMLEIVPMLQPEDVADAVIYILSTPPNVQIHDLIMQAIALK